MKVRTPVCLSSYPLIQGVIRKVNQDKVKIILFMPSWPREQWSPDLQPCSQIQYRMLPVVPYLLIQQDGGVCHLDQSTFHITTLAVGFKWSLNYFVLLMFRIS